MLKVQSYRDGLGIPAATFIFNHKSRPEGAFSQFPGKHCPIRKSVLGGIDKGCFGILAKTTLRSESAGVRRDEETLAPQSVGRVGLLRLMRLLGEKSQSAFTDQPLNFRSPPLTPV